MKTVLGIFSDREQAESALTELEKKGYSPKDISIITKEVSPGNYSGPVEDATTKTVGGATTGGLIGGIAGLLIGIGAITIPGIGAFLIGGPLAAALGSTGAAATTVSGAATGALAGGIVGALTSIGVPAESAKVYEERLREGGVLLAISAKDADGAVRDILQDHHADQIQTVNN